MKPIPLDLLAMMPHMHLRGKSFRYDLVYEDGRRETILDVPQYDFNWQTAYRLAEPIHVPAGTRMHCVAHFDNSEHNLSNPDPSSEVRLSIESFENPIGEPMGRKAPGKTHENMPGRLRVTAIPPFRGAPGDG